MDRHSSTILCVPNVFSVTAVRRVSLNLTVAAEWKTIVTSEHSLCLSSALRPRSGSDTSPLMHTTLLNTFSASTSDRIRSNTCARVNIKLIFVTVITLFCLSPLYLCTVDCLQLSSVAWSSIRSANFLIGGGSGPR